LFYQDYNSDWINYLTFDANGIGTSYDFASDVSTNGGPVHLITGLDTNLYYVVYNEGTNTSEVRRIRYQSSTNTAPTAVATATPTSGVPPLTVTFSSAGSSDPDKDPITYSWNFGDGGTSTAANPTHTYGTAGTYTAALTVTDSHNAFTTASVLITVGNNAPTATILAPADGTKYNVGDVIVLQGRGTDPQQGTLSGASLTWQVMLHHNEHVHFDLFPNLTGESNTITYLDHGDNTYLEICLTATDNGGLIDTKCVSVFPHTTTLTFKTKPGGLQVIYDGVSRPVPFSVTVPVGAKRDIIAPLSQGGRTFQSWSDGGAAIHSIIAGSQPATYTATYSTGKK
jgi:PKD repeat protein